MNGTTPQKPNILFLVWDACRLDAAREHAPVLADLAESNIWFENAVTAAGHSLSSHVSMMTGDYPSEHGVFHQRHMIDSTPLLDDLETQEYTRYGLSANGFASSMYGLDRSFDQFYNTQGQMVFPEGLDVHQYGRRIREAHEGEFNANNVDLRSLLQATIDHQYPVRSLLNISAAGLSTVVNSRPALQRIPHRRFSQFSEFSYSPNTNTALIRSILDREAKSDTPFFIFANYMDTHHPYAPPRRYQREFFGKEFGYRELSRINKLAHPWNYIQRVQNGPPIDDDFVNTVRGLYRGEVRTADEHLRRLLQALRSRDLFENTLIVVTADHGENLGETDRMGENRMGHVASASDNLLRVPLMVAHPELESERIHEYASLKNIRYLFTELGECLFEEGKTATELLCPENGVVSSQVPVMNGEALEKRYPSISADILQRHLSVSYLDDWKAVVTSTGDEHVWKNATQREIEDAPTGLIDTCRENLENLTSVSTDTRELTDVELSRLEALGYL